MKSYRTGPETDRLLHREFTTEDSAALFAINSNPDVMRFTGEPLLPSLDAAREAIVNYPDFEFVGYGRWACVLKQTQEVIGFCGLKYLSDLDAVDVGYRFLPRYWGCGFATEACTACLDFGFKTLQLDDIIGLVLPENVASVRVLKKAGMQLEGEFRYDDKLVLRFVKHSPSMADDRSDLPRSP